MQSVRGFTEAGNTTLTITGAAGTITRKVQGSFPACTVTVYLAGTVTLASIYSDNLSPATAKANPFTAAADGTWFFYAPNGRYDVQLSGGGLSTPFAIGDLWLYDSAPLIFDVTATPFLAKGDGSTDDSAAVAAAITAMGTAEGATLYFPGANAVSTSLVYRLSTVSLNGLPSGATVKGDGAGFYDGNDFSTQLKNNGIGATPIFQVSTNKDKIQFHDIQFAGASALTASLSGYAVQFLDAVAANNLSWIFQSCVFANLDHAIQYGSAGGQTGNQYLFTAYKDCTWFNNKKSIYSIATNVQQMSIENCLFTNGWETYVESTGALDLEMSNVYFGIMGIGATGAMSAAFARLKWYGGWSEITEGNIYNGSTFIAGATYAPLIISGVGASDPEMTSVLSGVFHPRYGDASGYSIYWDSGPLMLEGCGIGGKIRRDPRLAADFITLDNTQWIPVRQDRIAQTTGSSASHPWVFGAYNSTTADFYVKISVGGATGTATFQWKKTVGGAYSTAASTLGHTYMQDGLTVNFPPGVTWVLNDEWKFPCNPCGLIDVSSLTPEPSQGVTYSRNNVQAVNNNTTTTILFDTKVYDDLTLYSTSTGLFTAMTGGWYVISTVVQLTGVAAAYTFALLIQVNNTTIPGGQVNLSVANTGNNSSCPHHVITHLNPGDTVRVQVNQNSGSNLSVAASAAGSALMIWKRPELTTWTY